MSITILHPWLSTPEAAKAAKAATLIPLKLLGQRARIVGADELLSEAFAILTECALPLPEPPKASCAKCGGSLENVRRGAKFCSKLCKDLHGKKVERGKRQVIPASAPSHIGSMWSWPEDQRQQYAVQEVGYRLNNWLRTQHHLVEIPATEFMPNMAGPAEAAEVTPREFLEDYLESKGVKATGTETFRELYEAACWQLGHSADGQGREAA